MKVEMSFLERADYANLLRARAAQLRMIADDRSMSATREELLAEAKWREDRARKLDDAFEEKVSEKEPIRLPDDTKRDIDYIDKPKNGNGGKAASNG